MEKYISAETAAGQLRSYKIERDLMVSHNDTIDFAISVISAEVPPADVRPVVRGRWEIDNSYVGPGLMNLKCSVCGEFGGTWRENTFPSLLYKFCPNCGADMREVKTDD